MRKGELHSPIAFSLLSFSVSQKPETAERRLDLTVDLRVEVVFSKEGGDLREQEGEGLVVDAGLGQENWSWE